MSKEIAWNSLADNRILPVRGDWVIRLGIFTNKTKKVKKFEDDHVLFSSMMGDGKTTLGYQLQLKQPFYKTLAFDTHVSFLSKVDKHSAPEILFKDQKVYLYRFNAGSTPSYWFLYRNRSNT